MEASGDVDVLLLDKTGTITLGNREATEFLPMPGVAEAALAEAAQIASLADETPEGRSIVVLAKQYGIREHHFDASASFVPFSAETRMSGVDLDGYRLRKGAGDAIINFVAAEGGQAPPELKAVVDRVAGEGGTPLAVSRDSQVLGVVYLKDVVKEGMSHRFDQLRAMGIRTVMVTGDNPLTAAKIAGESGRGRFPRRGHTRAQARADPRGAARGPARRDDGRRHKRRSGARPGRRGRGDEHRAPRPPARRATWSTSTRTRRS